MSVKLCFTSSSFNICSWVLLTITPNYPFNQCWHRWMETPGSERIITTFPATYGHCQLYSVSCHQWLILKIFLEHNHPSNILSYMTLFTVLAWLEPRCHAEFTVKPAAVTFYLKDSESKWHISRWNITIYKLLAYNKWIILFY